MWDRQKCSFQCGYSRFLNKLMVMQDSEFTTMFQPSFTFVCHTWIDAFYSKDIFSPPPTIFPCWAIHIGTAFLHILTHSHQQMYLSLCSWLTGVALLLITPLLPQMPASSRWPFFPLPFPTLYFKKKKKKRSEESLSTLTSMCFLLFLQKRQRALQCA